MQFHRLEGIAEKCPRLLRFWIVRLAISCYNGRIVMLRVESVQLLRFSSAPGGGCKKMHPPEHLWKDVIKVVIFNFRACQKSTNKIITPTLQIAKTHTNQCFAPIQKGRQPRIEIDVLLWKMLILLIQSGVGAL